MATETEEAGPEVARDGLLRGIGELRAFDVSGIIPQLLLELPTDERASQTTWDTIIGKLTARQYTTYAALHSDVLAATGVLAIPDKKRSKLQKACGKVLKDMRKAWHGAEVKTRMQLYEWHPGGPTKAHEDEVAHLSICERHIAECRAKARKAQIYQSFIDHPAPKMAEMGEMAVARLQATQHVASTNDFQADTLAVHSALMARLPPLSHYAPQHMHVPGGAEDAAAAQASAVLSQMPATTVVHTAGGALANVDDPEERPPPPRQVNNTPSQPWRVLRRATEWKSRWLHLRILDLAFQEAQLKDAIARHTEQQASEMRAASQAATLAKAPAPDPLYEPVPDAHVQRAGFAVADLENHAFFRESLDAAAAGDPDVLAAGDDGAVQDDSDGEVTLAELAVAFGGLYDRATELDVYLKNELHNTGATTMRAPSKIAPRKGVRPGRGSVAALAGRRASSDQARDAPKKRRTDAHHPMLPEGLVAQLKAPRQKGGGGGGGGVYVPMARRLGPEEVQAQMDAESSGEDDVSDAFYIELHAAAQKRAEAEREGRERANAERDPLARRQSVQSPCKPGSVPQLATQKSAPAGMPHLTPQTSAPASLTSPRPPAAAPAGVPAATAAKPAPAVPISPASAPAAAAAKSGVPAAAGGAAGSAPASAAAAAAAPAAAVAAAGPAAGVAAEQRTKAVATGATGAAQVSRGAQSGAVAAVSKSGNRAADAATAVTNRPLGFAATAAAVAAAAGISGTAPSNGGGVHPTARGRQSAAAAPAGTAAPQGSAAPAAATNGDACKRGTDGKSEEPRSGKKPRTS